MAVEELEIFPVKFYFALQAALDNDQEDEFYNKFPHAPLANEVLWESEQHRIAATLAKSPYRTWVLSDNRPEGFDPTTHAFIDEMRLVYRYFPVGLTPQGPTRVVNRIVSGDPGYQKVFPPALIREIEQGLAPIAKDYIEMAVYKWSLDKIDLERYGVQFIVRLRLDWTCVQLMNPRTGRMTTRSMASMNTQLEPVIPDPERLRAAEDVVAQDPSFKAWKSPIAKPVQVREFFALPRTGWQNIGVLGNGLVPAANELGKATAVQRMLYQLHLKYTNQMAKDMTALNKGKRRYRPEAKPLFSLDDSAQQRSVFRNPIKTADVMEFFTPRRAFGPTGVRQPKRENQISFTPFCTEPGLYLNFEVVVDVCITTPHPHTSFGADERYMTQCMGFYPLQSTAFVSATTNEAVEAEEPNLFYVMECTRQGWRKKPIYSGDPETLMRTCEEAKGRGETLSLLGGGSLISKLDKAAKALYPEDPDNTVLFRPDKSYLARVHGA
eukprot:Blabericola_migrator_1__1546@NODE_1409_length_4611_cov_20_763424_g937_i0_p1_GENE_NODE_1409_length_4611_cov_20_763424_g937_i0NODE_1409_length_4611_cov_20_763424_g937_i0_p1_ORF_typecomplete_len495_score84_80_NODE_1409_length_4611_cov_20_763424_g937_i05121996